MLLPSHLSVVLGTPITAIDSKWAQVSSSHIKNPYQPIARSCQPTAWTLKLSGLEVLTYLAHFFLGFGFFGLTFFDLGLGGRPTLLPYVPGPCGMSYSY